MELYDAVIYGFPYKLRPKPKIASCASLVSSPDQTFRARPADSSKNRVWTGMDKLRVRVRVRVRVDSSSIAPVRTVKNNLASQV